MHNFLDEPFYIYALKGLYAGTKDKYPLLAFFSALLVFCEVAQRSSCGMSRFDIFFLNWYDSDAMEGIKVLWDTADCVCLHWCCVSERPHACMLRCHVGGNSFECDIFLFFRLRWVNA